MLIIQLFSQLSPKIVLVVQNPNPPKNEEQIKYGSTYGTHDGL